MAYNASRRGAANLGTPLMIVAFIVIGGFLYWLYLQAEAERELELQEQARIAAEEAERQAMGDFITVDDVMVDASPYMGRTVSMEDVEVASTLGSQGVWLDVPGGSPFLVSFNDSIRNSGMSASSGQTVTVTGMIYEMNDSTVTAWESAGTISSNDRLAAEFATHYLEANRARVTGTAPAPSGAGAGDGQGEGGN